MDLAVDLRHVTPVEVDSQVGNARNRTRVHEVFLTVGGHHSTGEGEVAIEPARQDRPAVDLGGNLAEPFAHDIRIGLGHQPRRVRVRADNTEPRGVVFRDPPRNDGAIADDEVAAGAGGVVVKQCSTSKPCCLEAFGDVFRCVIGGWTLADEIDERLCHTPTLRCWAP